MLAIPQVKEKLPMLQRVCDEGFFDSATALTLEEVRRELRSIVKFLVGMARRKVIYTSLSDPVTTVEYGVTVIPEEDFADYKLKVTFDKTDRGFNPPRYVEITKMSAEDIKSLRNDVIKARKEVEDTWFKEN